jgi:nucleotide-binding universal stress UspA family protein
VVGVDSTPTSHAAVEWAVAEAVARKAPLHIVHSWVWPHLAPWLTSADREMHDDLARAGETLISSYRIAARNAGATEITSEVREGAPREVLSALSKQAQLLVVGSRHLGGLARTVLGSTSRAVAGESSCPTIVVTGSSGAPRRAGRLIVGISTAPSDEPVLQFAFDYAQDHGLPIHALFCWDTDDTPLPRLPIPQSTRAWLGESIAGWRGRFPDVPVQASVRVAQPVAGLLDAADDDAMIVVGRRAHRPPLLGSHLGAVGLGVVHHAGCAVAIVPN